MARGGVVQVKNPGIDLPIGIVGSLLVCAFLYALMCVVICLMVPYALIDINAPFSEVRFCKEFDHHSVGHALSPSVQIDAMLPSLLKNVAFAPELRS